MCDLITTLVTGVDNTVIARKVRPGEYGVVSGDGELFLFA